MGGLPNRRKSGGLAARKPPGRAFPRRRPTPKFRGCGRPAARAKGDLGSLRWGEVIVDDSDIGKLTAPNSGFKYAIAAGDSLRRNYAIAKSAASNYRLTYIRFSPGIPRARALSKRDGESLCIYIGSYMSTVRCLGGRPYRDYGSWGEDGFDCGIPRLLRDEDAAGY